MPGSRTLAQLVTQVRRRADMENTTFVTDSEIEQYIHDSYGELYDLIIESAGEEHFITSTTFSTIADTASYALSDQLGQEGPFEVPPLALEIYKTLGVDVLFNGEWLSLAPHRLGERNIRGDVGWAAIDDVVYRVYTNLSENPLRQIEFSPTPTSVYSVRFRYIPIPSDLSGDGTSGGDQTFQSFTGWDEFIVCDAAAKCLEKEESDSRHLLARKMAAGERIRWHATTMNQESGGKVRNVDAERRRRSWQR